MKINEIDDGTSLRVRVGRQFLTPLGCVIECLGDDGVELQCRYVHESSKAFGSVDFTRAFAHGNLIPL